MKRLFLLTLFVATASVSVGQNAVNQRESWHYLCEINFGYAIRTNDRGSNSFNMEVINGASSQYFSGGVGVGFNAMFAEKVPSSVFPFTVFADLKGYYPINPDYKLSLYFAVDLGMATDIKQRPDSFETQKYGSGFYYSVGPGFKCPLFDLGLRYQHLGYWGNAIVIQVGFWFNESQGGRSSHHYRHYRY